MSIQHLESRRLLTSVPVLETFRESELGVDVDGGDEFLQVANPTPLNLASMQRTTATGTLPGSDAGDVYKVSLEAGQLVTIGVLAEGVADSPMRLVVADASGQTVAKNLGVSVDPESGAAADGLALTYRATAAGDYFVGLFNQFPETTPADRSYGINVRPVGISTKTPDNASLNFEDGAMYAQLRAGMLQIIGPTGYGFELAGKWTKTVTNTDGATQQTYTATGNVALVTPLGNLPAPLPQGGAIIVSTKPNGWDGAFGEIDKSRIVSGLQWLDEVIKAQNGQFGIAGTLPEESLGFDVLQGTEVGLALGSTITTSIDINAPLNPAIPYLYFVSSGGASGSFGGITVAAAQSRLSFIVDPADPSLYVGVNLPVGPLPDLAVGGSFKGLIPLPLKPTERPSQYDPKATTFRGHLYHRGEANIPTPIPGLKVNVGGTVLLNLNANGDGGLLKYLRDDAPMAISNAFAQQDFAPLLGGLADALITDFGFGASGMAGITLDAADVGVPVSFRLTLAKGTLIATGTADPKVFFRGLFTDNLLKGTFLEEYMKFVRPVQMIVLDGASATDMLTASFSSKFEYFGFEADADVTIQANQLDMPGAETLLATVTARVNLDGVIVAPSVMFTGVIASDGTFQLTGTSDIEVFGFKMTQGQLIINNAGVAVAGAIDLGPLGNAMMSGMLTDDGAFELTGSLMTNYGLGAVLPTVRADLTLSNDGLKASSQITLLGAANVGFSGSFNPDGTFRLTGSSDVEVFGFTLSEAALTITDSGVAVSGTLNLGAMGSATMSGMVTDAGDFELTGSSMTNFGLGPAAPIVRGDFTLSNDGLKVTSVIEFLGQPATMRGTITPELEIELIGTVDVAIDTWIAEFKTDVDVTLKTVNGTPRLMGEFDNDLSAAGVGLRVMGELTVVYDAFPPRYMGSGSTTGSLFGFDVGTVSGTVSNNRLTYDLPFDWELVLPLPL